MTTGLQEKQLGLYRVALTDAYTRLGEYLIDWPDDANAILRSIHREMGKALGVGE